MPNWNQLLNEITAAGSIHDVVRRRYLGKLRKSTGRNTIIYYSGWLQKKGVERASRWDRIFKIQKRVPGGPQDR